MVQSQFPRLEALHHQSEVDSGILYYKDYLNWVVRQLTAGTGISITDGGENAALTLATRLVAGTGIAIADSGGELTFSTTAGITTATTLLSAAFAIDSTGVKTVTTAHGLSSTPAIQDVQLTVTEDSDVDDWAFDLLKVESVDATNVVAKINVSTASATGAATAKLAIMILIGV